MAESMCAILSKGTLLRILDGAGQVYPPSGYIPVEAGSLTAPIRTPRVKERINVNSASGLTLRSVIDAGHTPDGLQVQVVLQHTDPGNVTDATLHLLLTTLHEQYTSVPTAFSAWTFATTLASGCSVREVTLEITETNVAGSQYIRSWRAYLASWEPTQTGEHMTTTATFGVVSGPVLS